MFKSTKEEEPGIGENSRMLWGTKESLSRWMECSIAPYTAESSPEKPEESPFA